MPWSTELEGKRKNIGLDIRPLEHISRIPDTPTKLDSVSATCVWWVSRHRSIFAVWVVVGGFWDELFHKIYIEREKRLTSQYYSNQWEYIINIICFDLFKWTASIGRSLLFSDTTIADDAIPFWFIWTVRPFVNAATKAVVYTSQWFKMRRKCLCGAGQGTSLYGNPILTAWWGDLFAVDLEKFSFMCGLMIGDLGWCDLVRRLCSALGITHKRMSEKIVRWGEWFINI